MKSALQLAHVNDSEVHCPKIGKPVQDTGTLFFFDETRYRNVVHGTTIILKQNKQY
jgi:hypothetical protein